MALTAADIAERWYGSAKGLTPLREAKAKALAKRNGVQWDDVLAAALIWVAESVSLDWTPSIAGRRPPTRIHRQRSHAAYQNY